MALRGLHYIPFFLVMPFALGSWGALLHILGLVFFAPLYFLSRVIWDGVEKHFGQVHWRIFNGTALAEWLTGIQFAIMLWGQYMLGS